jgi:methylated-DNA-[protein]-cysteine S-methyltransferase
MMRIIESPIGPVRLVVSQGTVIQIDFHWERVLSEELTATKEPLEDPLEEFLEDPVLAQVETALTDYFQQPQPLQQIPCDPQGTPFQRKVWQALREIPLGQVMTYGELAEQLGSSPRAVGGACRNNPVPLIIPCHRVISKNGIGGFSGQWGEGEKVNVKQWLLRHEQVLTYVT